MLRHQATAEVDGCKAMDTLGRCEKVSLENMIKEGQTPGCVMDGRETFSVEAPLEKKREIFINKQAKKKKSLPPSRRSPNDRLAFLE